MLPNTRQVKVSDERVEWRSILCETNASRAKIAEIQLALRKAGYDPGRSDGVIGDDTVKAVNEFQRAKKLPVDKYLNIETVRALGVDPLP